MNAIIFGASGGIGGALCQAVIASGDGSIVSQKEAEWRKTQGECKQLMT